MKDNTRLAVCFLGIIGTLCVLGALGLAAMPGEAREVPQFIVAQGGAAVAAIAGLVGGAQLGRRQATSDLRELADATAAGDGPQAPGPVGTPG